MVLCVLLPYLVALICMAENSKLNVYQLNYNYFNFKINKNNNLIANASAISSCLVLSIKKENIKI